MKTLIKSRLVLLGFLVAGWMGANGQSVIESEVPGDNFSLEGALELFKESSSPEEFERKLNSPDSKVNNLDLNNDGYIDYMRVIDRARGNVHAFIIQAVLSKSESQDVAVIELEKLENGRAVLQITGDADVYGIETIIEPTEEVYVNAGTTRARRVVNVWSWPSVQYVYHPYYVVYVSPWYWSYRPYWWSPWRPVAYYVYDPWWRPYRSYYSVCHSHRIIYAQEIYRPYRTTSVIVHNHYGTQINNYRSRNESGRRGRDRHSHDDDRRSDNGSRSASNANNSDSPSDWKTRGNSDGRRRFVDNSSEWGSGSGSTEQGRSNERTKESMKTRPVQTTWTGSENRESTDRPKPTHQHRSKSEFQTDTKPLRTVREMSDRQKSTDRTSDFKPSTGRSTGQPSYDRTRKTESGRNGESGNVSRPSQDSGIRSERISKPTGTSDGSPGNRVQKSKGTRGQN